jgi:hypothetical protein
VGEHPRALLKAVRDRRPNLVDDIEQAVEVRVTKQHVAHRNTGAVDQADAATGARK